jgi:hypothetical protein
LYIIWIVVRINHIIVLLFNTELANSDNDIVKDVSFRNKISNMVSEKKLKLKSFYIAGVYLDINVMIDVSKTLAVTIVPIWIAYVKS